MGLDTIEIVLAIEQHFGISIPDKVAARCVTVEDMQKEVAELLARKRGCSADSLLKEVWEGIVQETATQMDMDPSKITPNSKWVGDITKHG